MKKIFVLLAVIMLFSLPAHAARQTIADGNTILTYSDINDGHNANYGELYGGYPAKWTSGETYTASNRLVVHDEKVYICTSTHTAAAATEPDNGASW